LADHRRGRYTRSATNQCLPQCLGKGRHLDRGIRRTENLQHYLERHWRSQKAGARDKVVLQWPHFVWSAAKVLVTFWQRSHQQLSIADLRRSNFIIPPADYQIGATLIRLEIAAEQADLATLLSTFWQQFVQAGESGKPSLPVRKRQRSCSRCWTSAWRRRTSPGS
jgi:hypothetical protein